MSYYALLEPADGKCYVGAIANSETNYDDWISQTGLSQAAVGGWYNGGFAADNTGGTFSAALAITLAHSPGTPAIHWSFRCLKTAYGDTARGNLTRMANGESDAFIITQLANLRAPGRPVFLRWGWEMNGSWGNSTWSWLYHNSDDSHNSFNTPTAYKQAFRRISLIAHGGTRATVNAALAGLGMPALTDGGSSDLPTGNVAVVWCPNTGPNPTGAHATATDNLPEAYYPGDAYVDWVGIDTYAGDWSSWASGAAITGGLDNVYALYSASASAKPFGIWEVGNKGDDTKGPAFATAMFDWIESHSKAKLICWFASSTGSDLPSQNPLTMDVWGARVSAKPSRYILDGTTVATAPDPPVPNTSRTRGRMKW